MKFRSCNWIWQWCSRNWSQQKPDLFRLCDYSRWSCMHGLQVNLVSGMAQANNTKGGTSESFVGGETVVLLGTFSNLPEKTNLELKPKDCVLLGVCCLEWIHCMSTHRRWFSPCKGFLSQIASWLLCTICLFHYHSGIPSWKKTKWPWFKKWHGFHGFMFPVIKIWRCF